MLNRRKKQAMRGKSLEKMKKPAYLAPRVVVHGGAEYIRKLGPAQACSPSPGF